MGVTPFGHGAKPIWPWSEADLAIAKKERLNPAATRFARAVGVGLPERSEPEEPQGAEGDPPKIAQYLCENAFWEGRAFREGSGFVSSEIVPDSFAFICSDGCQG